MTSIEEAAWEDIAHRARGLMRIILAAFVMVILAFLLLVIAVTGAVPAAAQTDGTKIVFLAGPKDHGAVGRHEYEKELRELAWQFEHATNLKGIKTEVLVGKAPRDLSVFQD